VACLIEQPLERSQNTSNDVRRLFLFEQIFVSASSKSVEVLKECLMVNPPVNKNNATIKLS
jgi:hypothetical protein